jgi:hypothetical protein
VDADPVIGDDNAMLLSENGFMHIMRAALFKDNYLDHEQDLPPYIWGQLSEEAQVLLRRWLEDAP